jgi:hypothetical protein
MCVIVWAMLLFSGSVPTHAQSTGGVATSAVGRVGQRQTGVDDAINNAPTARIRGRIESRVESRLRTRIQSGYDPQESAASQLDAAVSRASTTRR